MIFSFYSHSAKRLRELEDIADKLKVKFNKFGSLHQCRWVASQLRALNVLRQNYRATCEHCQTIIEEGSKDAAKASGILTRLRSPKFVTFFLFMIDFIQVITTLSKLFQEENVLIVDVLPQLEVAMLQLVEMQSSPGISISSLTKGKVFNEVDLSGEVEPELQKLHTELVTAAIDFMDARFKPLQTPPYSDFKVFNFMQWPYDKVELVSYGMVEVNRLIQHFTPVLTEEEIESALHEWLAFKIHVSNLRHTQLRIVYRDLMNPPVSMKHFLPLLEIMLTLSMSTAQVERGFSHMNIIKRADQSNLANDSLNNCMEIKINGPADIKDFTANAAIDHWFNSGGPRHLDGHASSNS